MTEQTTLFHIYTLSYSIQFTNSLLSSDKYSLVASEMYTGENTKSNTIMQADAGWGRERRGEGGGGFILTLIYRIFNKLTHTHTHTHTHAHTHMERGVEVRGSYLGFCKIHGV